MGKNIGDWFNNLVHPNQDKAWDQIKNEDTKDQLANYDFYNDQQLGRSNLEKPKTKASRVPYAILGGLGVFIGLYLCICLFIYLANIAGDRINQDTNGNTYNVQLVDANQGKPKKQWVKKRWYLTYDGKDGKHYADANKLIVPKNCVISNAKNFNLDGIEHMAFKRNLTLRQVYDYSKDPQKAGNLVIYQKPKHTFWGSVFPLRRGWFLFSLVMGIGFGIGFYTWLLKMLEAQNAGKDISELNQYHDDGRLMVPEEFPSLWEPFPDSGYHSSVRPTALISHSSFTNEGLKKVRMAEHYDKDTQLSADPDDIAYKGELVTDDDGYVVYKTKPIFNLKFMADVFTQSGLPDDKELRKSYNPKKTPYVPASVGDKKKYGKLGIKTVADLINYDWTLPEYEVQRAAGIYWVDTNPVNVMVLAMTRAGKGQTYIEPYIDMLTRVKDPDNIVINDPKGELLTKFYVPGTKRGFQIIQFNLLNRDKTDIYNPLMLAADKARIGDIATCQEFVKDLGNIFFPTGTGGDDFWNKAANNMFQKAALGLIAVYMEKEKTLRLRAMQTNMDPMTLNTKLDHLWGHVTLFNCYQMVVQLSDRKIKDPVVQFNNDTKSGEEKQRVDERLADRNITSDNPNFASLEEAEINKDFELAQKESKVWKGKPETDMFTLMFNAFEMLPTNNMLRAVLNASQSLNAMAGSDKTMASVAGIAITGMSFFADETISQLTSGTPSQNTDLAGVSFPRRIGFRVAADYFQKHHFRGNNFIWQAFSDPNFTKSLGSDFAHSGTFNGDRWATMFFKGIFPNETTYLRCEIRNSTTDLLLKTFYFKFKKAYLLSLSGTEYIRDPVLNTKIVRDGSLYELISGTDSKTGKKRYIRGRTIYRHNVITNLMDAPDLTEVKRSVVEQTSIHYSEKPKMIFLITPPQKAQYAKILLILISQLTSLSFDQAYTTKENQKPLYATDFVLDELGNLESEKHGIENFPRLLSIGLGQDQRFTLILQVLQQLKDVYGEKEDKIIQGNTADIIFLKSTDDTMIDTLVKMSGKRHVVRHNSLNVTEDVGRYVNKNEHKLAKGYAPIEESVLNYNDFNLLPERNSIVFTAGHNPIWNRNQTILPMSWRLLWTKPIVFPGHQYSFNTLPTLSTAMDFDINHNQPDFYQIAKDEIKKAIYAEEATNRYKEVYGYSDYEFNLLDLDERSDDIMNIIDAYVHHSDNNEIAVSDDIDDLDELDEQNKTIDQLDNKAEKNTDLEESINSNKPKYDEYNKDRYAHGKLSRSDLLSGASGIQNYLGMTFAKFAGSFKQDKEHFSIRSTDGALMSRNGQVEYIVPLSKKDENQLKDFGKQAADPNNTHVIENDSGAIAEQSNSYRVTDDFMKYLAKFDNWHTLMNGKFDDLMSQIYDEVGRDGMDEQYSHIGAGV